MRYIVLQHDELNKVKPRDLSSSGWLVRDQIIALYNGNVQLVDTLIMKKKAAGQYREHPDPCMADDPGMTMYYAPRSRI